MPLASGYDALLLERAAHLQELVPGLRRLEAELVEDLAIDEQTKRLRGERHRVDLLVRAHHRRGERFVREVCEFGHGLAGQGHEIAGLGELLGAAVGLDVDDVRALARGERRRQDGAVALVLVALESDLDVRVLLGELVEELRVLAAILLAPRPEGQFCARLRHGGAHRKSSRGGRRTSKREGLHHLTAIYRVRHDISPSRAAAGAFDHIACSRTRPGGRSQANAKRCTSLDINNLLPTATPRCQGNGTRHFRRRTVQAARRRSAAPSPVRRARRRVPIAHDGSPQRGRTCSFALPRTHR